MDITKAEYKLLKKFYRHEFLIVDNDIVDTLRSKKLIDYKSYKIQRDGSIEHSPELIITNNGKIVFEKYREDHQQMRRTSIHAWIAIIISLLALTVAGADLYFSHIVEIPR